MKRKWRIIFGAIGFLGIGAVLTIFLLDSASPEKRAAQETRRILRDHGLKTELSEFDFSTSPELRARMTALTNAPRFNFGLGPEEFARHSRLQQAMPELLIAVGTNSAVALWQRERLPLDQGAIWYLQSAGATNGGFWPALREFLDDDREILEAASAAALSGQIRFHLDASRGLGLLLPHLAAVKEFARMFGTRAVLELHDGNREAAWTNLLAVTRLVTAWSPEPTEVSMLVRFACTTIAFNSTWQALQAGGWSDEQLAKVQREWESADFLKSVPETGAYLRAGATARCEFQRREPVTFNMTPQEVLFSPKSAWDFVRDYRWRRSYRDHGSYEDEKDLLLYFRDRELEIRRALECKTWAQMRSLPGVTNVAPFVSKHHSSIASLLSVRQIMVSSQMSAPPESGHTLLARAADAEARRRIVITAIALERYRAQHGSYPDSLEKLVPGFLHTPPIDFMDGRPLRYRLAKDHHFVLYSTGLDCEDNGGIIPSPRRDVFPAYQMVRYSSPLISGDLVWPRPASMPRSRPWP
jgi:hypothetical protein